MGILPFPPIVNKIILFVVIGALLAVGFLFLRTENEPHIVHTAETVLHIGSFPITNSMIMAWLGMAIIVVIGLAFSFKNNIIPGKLQNFGELIVESGVNFCTSVMGSRHNAEKVFPLIATLFIFILLSNWLGLLPGVGSIGKTEVHPHEYALDGEKVYIEGSTAFVKGEEYPIGATFVEGKRASVQGQTIVTEDEHFIPILRSAYADLNMTLALAIIAVLATHIFGIAAISAKKHIKKYINFSSPLNFFVGILELFGEISKTISFSFRLFGNIFAGEVLLVIVLGIMPLIIPLPFFGLEVFVGFIQALVFSMLTLVFIQVAMMEGEH